MMNTTIQHLKGLKESEDKVEFKAARNNFSYKGSNHSDPKDRRKCVLGYCVALANEGGGMLVFGMEDDYPHIVCGTTFAAGLIGDLEDQIYEDLKMRVRIQEILDPQGRVLVFHVPPRPIGRIMKFEGVGLMRVGESLRVMSDEESYAILSEREPDFSATTHPVMSLNDLDNKAIRILRERYAGKSGNSSVMTLRTKQLLSDLGLIKGEKLTYAALILLGQKSAIKTYLPQMRISVEYRLNPSAITFDDRKFFEKSYLVEVDELWKQINLRNSKTNIQQGAYMVNIPFFNEEVIREALNNAVAHRDYTKESEIVIKQSHEQIEFISPGGFPFGVNEDNILTVSSTPRNRLLADVLLKIGLVERSGQGVDKMVKNCVAEAKSRPNYSNSDYFQVTLTLSSKVHDKSFAVFVNEIQKKTGKMDEMGVNDILTLYKVRNKQNIQEEEFKASVQKLTKMGIIMREKGGRKGKFEFTEKYIKLLN